MLRQEFCRCKLPTSLVHTPDDSPNPILITLRLITARNEDENPIPLLRNHQAHAVKSSGHGESDRDNCPDRTPATTIVLLHSPHRTRRSSHLRRYCSRVRSNWPHGNDDMRTLHDEDGCRQVHKRYSSQASYSGPSCPKRIRLCPIGQRSLVGWPQWNIRSADTKWQRLPGSHEISDSDCHVAAFPDSSGISRSGSSVAHCYHLATVGDVGMIVGAV